MKKKVMPYTPVHSKENTKSKFDDRPAEPHTSRAFYAAGPAAAFNMYD